MDSTTGTTTDSTTDTATGGAEAGASGISIEVTGPGAAEAARITDRVYAIVARQLGVTAGELRPDTHFRSLPNADSMHVLQIILDTENEFGIEIEGDATFRIETIGQYLDLVAGLCRLQAAS